MYKLLKFVRQAVLANYQYLELPHTYNNHTGISCLKLNGIVEKAEISCECSGKKYSIRPIAIVYNQRIGCVFIIKNDIKKQLLLSLEKQLSLKKNENRCMM